LEPLDPDHATKVLADLVELHRAGLREPLPLPTVSAEIYATRRRGGADAAAALEEALRRWQGGGAAERSDAAHARVWGVDAGPEVLTAADGGLAEPTRFGSLAMALWTPLLAAEDVVRR
jgi:exodeoxyribonuclease V gamma subunit